MILFALLSDGSVRLGYSGGSLLVIGAVPPHLEPAAKLLKTGLGALASNQPWYGCIGQTGQVIQLSPDRCIPDGVTLLTIDGAAKWDRIHSAARFDHPDLFDPVAIPQAHKATAPVRESV